MKLPVFFRRLARNEFEDALEWYEKKTWAWGSVPGGKTGGTPVPPNLAAAL